jgi:FMN reductase
MVAIISSSLKTESNSRILAREAQRVLESEGAPATLIDLRDFPLPLCDGATAYAHPNVARVGEVLRAADTLLIATPIYNYDATATIKNLIELTGDAWENKVVGFLCAAGGMSSYMSIMSFANSLMLDFRSVIVPRFVYATGTAFSEDQIVDAEIRERVAEMARFAAHLGRQLAAA